MIDSERKGGKCRRASDSCSFLPAPTTKPNQLSAGCQKSRCLLCSALDFAFRLKFERVAGLPDRCYTLDAYVDARLLSGGVHPYGQNE